MLKELENFIAIKKIEKDNYNFMMIDFQSTSVIQPTTNGVPYGVISPQVLTISNKLTKKFDIEEIKKDFLETAKKLAIKNYNSDLSLMRKFDITDDSNSRKIIAKILNASNYIACNGRTGPGNFIITSESNYRNYDLKLLKNMELYLADIPDIVVGRKNSIDQPGMVLIYNNDKYIIESIGYHPEYQFMIVKNRTIRKKKLERILKNELEQWK